MLNQIIIDQSKEIYRQAFYSCLHNIEALEYWPNEDVFWSGKEQSLERIEKLQRPESWWRENCGVVAEKATTEFQRWLKESSITSSFNFIDEKGRLHEPFSVEVGEMPATRLEELFYWIVSYTHPISSEKIVRDPIGPTAELEDSDLNNFLSKDMLFFTDSEDKIQGKMLAVPRSN
jgi:hypothetical protein